MNRHAQGSNQYKKKLAPQSLIVPPQIKNPTQNTFKRCGDVWGTQCKAKVFPPTWTHGTHPSYEIRLRLSDTPHTPTTLLLALIKRKGSYSIIKNIVNKHTITEQLKQAIITQHPLYAMSLWGKNPSLLPPNCVEYFAKHPTAQVRARAAQLPYLPPHICRLLREDVDKNVRINLVGNSHLPKSTRNILLQDPTSTVKSTALRHFGTPNDITTDIINHPSPNIRAAAAHCSNTPTQLDQLIRDSEYSVWHTALLNPHTTTTSLSWIIKHQQIDRIPHSILRHPNCPPNIFSQNIQWTSSWKQYLIRFPDTPPTLLTQLSRSITLAQLRILAQHAHLPETAIHQLAHHQDKSVRRAIASRPDLPVDVYDQLSQDRAYTVKSLIARNQNTPPHILTRLALHKTPHLSASALANPNCPPNVRALHTLAL